MKIFKLLLSLLLMVNCLRSQSVQSRLGDAVKKLQNDSTMKHSILSVYVVNSITGETIYNLNEQIGLAPASCQKIFTSIAAMELLGHDYKYSTDLAYDGTIQNNELSGNLYIVGHGDPSLGSWRYAATKDSIVINQLLDAIKRSGIKKIKGSVYADHSNFSSQPLPGGWIWDDIGNYYGAGHWGLNWHENQYDLFMHPGDKEGDDVAILYTEPSIPVSIFHNQLKTGKKGSGDNASIYLVPYASSGFVEGTVPAGEKEFHISGSLPDPASLLLSTFKKQLIINGIEVGMNEHIAVSKPYTILYNYLSPPLDSINYYFLKRSVNLYGEALLRTIAFENTGSGTADSGLAVIKKFWQERGIDKAAMRMMDGSGLSPQNRVTTYGLVTALQYAKTRPWFSSFYFDLPEYNKMKLKSGTIGGVKSFAGYHKAKDGTEYTVAIIVNNYAGSAAAVVNKMFAVLDELK